MRHGQTLSAQHAAEPTNNIPTKSYVKNRDHTVERPVMVYSTLCSEYILEDKIQCLVTQKHTSSGVTTRFKETRIPIHVANLMKPKSYALKLLQASAGQY